MYDVCMYDVVDAAAAVIIVIVLLLGGFVASVWRVAFGVRGWLLYSTGVGVCVFVCSCVRVFGK